MHSNTSESAAVFTSLICATEGTITVLQFVQMTVAKDMSSGREMVSTVPC
jgi:hypothetical protein